MLESMRTPTFQAVEVGIFFAPVTFFNTETLWDSKAELDII